MRLFYAFIGKTHIIILCILFIMSQSDFIQYKKIHTELKIDKKPKVLSSQNSTLYKQFTFENIIDSSNNFVLKKQDFNRLVPPNKIVIFNIEKDLLDLSCSPFLCNK